MDYLQTKKRKNLTIKKCSILDLQDILNLQDLIFDSIKNKD